MEEKNKPWEKEQQNGNEDFFADPRELFDLLSSKARVRTREEIDQHKQQKKEMTPKEIERAMRRDKRDSL